MAIIYGAMIAHLAPVLSEWWSRPTGLVVQPPAIPETLRWTLLGMALGVFLSGVRDLRAAWATGPSSRYG
jgi:hypothetical protein